MTREAAVNARWHRLARSLIEEGRGCRRWAKLQKHHHRWYSTTWHCAVCDGPLLPHRAGTVQILTRPRLVCAARWGSVRAAACCKGGRDEWVAAPPVRIWRACSAHLLGQTEGAPTLLVLYVLPAHISYARVEYARNSWHSAGCLERSFACEL